MQTDRTKVIFKGKPVHLHSPGEISSGELHLQCSAAFGAATPSAIPPPPLRSGSYLPNPLPGGNLPLLVVLQVMYTLAKTSFLSQDPRSKARAVKAGRAPDRRSLSPFQNSTSLLCTPGNVVVCAHNPLGNPEALVINPRSWL